MMSKIKMVIVPCWLNLVSKELGITGDDLANCEKLSGIVSPRDFLIYKMVNFQAAEVLASKVFDGDVATASQFVQDYEGAVDIPTLEERSACANVSIDTLIYGSTNESMIREGLGIRVELTDLETMVIHLVPYRCLTDEEKQAGETLAKQVSRLVFNRTSIQCVAGTAAFERFVQELPVEQVFY